MGIFPELYVSFGKISITMKELGKPVPNNIDKHIDLAKEITGLRGSLDIDFQNTEIAFSHLSNTDLKKSLRLFGLMNHHWLVGLGAKIGVPAIKLKLPFVQSVVKKTIFHQFCGGTNLLETQNTIDKLQEKNVLTILDYGAEGKESEADCNVTMNETIRAIHFASKKDAVPVVSSKMTGLASNALLEKLQAGKGLSTAELRAYRSLLKRIDAICYNASIHNTAIYFDAEETWIQQSIDHIVTIMMRRYNKKKIVVYNTHQMYLKDRLQYLIDSFDLAEKRGYLIGAKLVRGAYMEKERERAQEMDYPSPIYDTKEATDESFDTGIRFCLSNFEKIGLSNATHNEKSNRLMAEYMEDKGIPRDHPNLNFSQLLGMSDNITFNLAHAGFNAAKYVPYGPIAEVVPYLIRRAEENSSITGDMSREFKLVQTEVKRRSL